MRSNHSKPAIQQFLFDMVVIRSYHTSNHVFYDLSNHFAELQRPLFNPQESDLPREAKPEPMAPQVRRKMDVLGQANMELPDIGGG